MGIMVGLLLGDANIRLTANNTRARLQFKQSMIHFPYFWYVFMELSHYCSGPRVFFGFVFDLCVCVFGVFFLNWFFLHNFFYILFYTKYRIVYKKNYV